MEAELLTRPATTFSYKRCIYLMGAVGRLLSRGLFGAYKPIAFLLKLIS